MLKKHRRNKELLGYFKVYYRKVNIEYANSEDVIVRCSIPYLQQDMTWEYGHNKGVDSDEAIAYTVSHLIHAYLFDKYGITVEKPRKEQDYFTFRISNAYLPRRK